MNQRGELQHKQRAPDGAGGWLETWVTLRPLWLDEVIPTGRVATVAQQLTATVDAEIRVRLATDITAGMRLVVADITYSIEAVLAERRRRRMRLLCSSVPHP